MMTDERRAWLRGAYLDRIIETAQAYAAGHTHFADAEWLEYIGDDFRYLIELSAEDHAYLREAAGLEAFRRIVTTLSATREAVFGKLRSDNADVINADARFAMDIGWVDLLQDAVDRVRTYPSDWRVRIDGAKEKFGCCVVHVTCDYTQRGCRSEVERLREEVRLRSLSSCEICGESGRLRLSGYAKTVCDRHAPVMGEFREHDGRWSDPYKWHDDQVDIDLLKDMDPVTPRPKDHAVDLLSQTDVARQIENDIENNFGRKADLLIEFIGMIEIAVVAAMSVADEDVDFWLKCEVERWQSVQPLSDEDRVWLRRYLRSLAIDERGRRQRREDGAKALKGFFADNSSLGREVEKLSGRERELLATYAGDFADSARGSVVKAEFLDGYVRDEVDLWPDVLELSTNDKEWLQRMLRKMIDAEYERAKNNR